MAGRARLQSCRKQQKKIHAPPGATNTRRDLFRIQIVLARLVDHSQLMPSGPLLISQYPIDFPQLQRSRIAPVPHANNEASLATLRVVRQSA
jgi:hypothetical protein